MWSRALGLHLQGYMTCSDGLLFCRMTAERPGIAGMQYSVSSNLGLPRTPKLIAAARGGLQ